MKHWGSVGVNIVGNRAGLSSLPMETAGSGPRVEIVYSLIFLFNKENSWKIFLYLTGFIVFIYETEKACEM